MAQREQGHVLGFVLVGALLVLMTIGGVYLVRHNLLPGETGGNDVASDNTSTDASDEEKGASSEDSSTASSDDSTNDEVATTDSDSSDTVTSTEVDEESAGSQDEADVDTEQASATEELPATGPGDTLLATVGSGLLVAAVLAYVRSRSLA